jgi:hypothetical protein
MTTERPEIVKLDFYALGKVNRNPQIHPYNNNKGIPDHSNNLLERNALSLNSSNLESIRNNYRSLHTVDEIKKETNNYLNPIHVYKSSEKYNINDNMTNKETYNITKEKLFAQDRAISNNTGRSVNKDDFVKMKSVTMNNLNSTTSENNNSISLPRIKENVLYFDKNNKNMIRYPKGFWNHNVK